MKTEIEIRAERERLTQLAVEKLKSNTGAAGFLIGARTALEWVIGEKDAVSSMSQRVDDWIASGRFGALDPD